MGGYYDLLELSGLWLRTTAPAVVYIWPYSVMVTDAARYTATVTDSAITTATVTDAARSTVTVSDN